MNTIKTMDMIDNTFDLMSKLEQFGPAAPLSHIKFETTVDNFTVRVEKLIDVVKRHSQFYRVSVKDEEKNELFRVETYEKSGVKTLEVYVEDKEIKDTAVINSLLDSAGFDGILENINGKITQKIKDEQLANPVKTDSQLVSNVMDRINKIRADSTTKKTSGFRCD